MTKAALEFDKIITAAGEDMSVLITWLQWGGSHVASDRVLHITGISATLLAVFMAWRSSRKSLRHADESAQRSERRNKEKILKDSMICIMNNVVPSQEEVVSNSKYNGRGMKIIYPFDSHVDGGDLGIIASWSTGTSRKRDCYLKLHHLIFRGDEEFKDSLIPNRAWETHKDALCMVLTRTSDGYYALIDQKHLKDASDYKSSIKTACLDDEKFDYLKMLLDWLAIAGLDELMTSQIDYEKVINSKTENNSDVS